VTAGNALWAFWIFSLAVTALGLIFRERFLDLLGMAPSLRIHARRYLTVLLFGNVFSTGFSVIMRAEGKLRYATLQWVIPVCLNIAVDALFVLVFRWGITGSALATVLCQFVSFSMALIYFLRVSDTRPFGKRLSLRVTADIVTAGIPALVPQAAMAAGMVVLNHLLLALGGERGQMIYAYVSKVFLLCMMPFTAVMLALTPIAGQNIGAKIPGRVRQLLRWSIALCAAAALAETAVCGGFPLQILSLMTRDRQTAADCAQALRVLSAGLPLLFLPMLAGALYQAAGRKLGALALYGCELAPVLPLAILFGKSYGLDGIWYSFPVTGAFGTLVCSAVLARYCRRMERT